MVGFFANLSNVPQRFVQAKVPPFWVGMVVFLSMIFCISMSHYVALVICVATILFYICCSSRVDAPPRYVYWISLSFLFYFALQSPLFATSNSTLEAAYFSLKLASLVALFVLKYKFPRYHSAIPIIILSVFYFDSLFIDRTNLGIAKTLTEYFSIWESLVALIVTSCFLQIFYHRSHRREIQTTLILLFVVAHFANYFSAGFTKALLNGGVFSWLENPTFVTLKRATLWGLNVLPATLLENPFVPLFEKIGNMTVLGGQLASILIVAFPWLVAPLTLFYDFFHIGVGALAGVWFYKWIFVNVIIYCRRKDIVAGIRLLNWRKRLALTLVVPFFYLISSVPHLGWYEVYQGSLIYAYGVNKDGSKDRLHPQYFGSAAFSILAKNTHNAFQESYPQQMGSQDIAELQASRGCNRKRITSPNLMWSRNNLTKITERVLDEDRSDFSKLMHQIQPFHLLIPSRTFNNSVFYGDYHAIEFRNMHVCIDQAYDIKIHEMDNRLRVRN